MLDCCIDNFGSSTSALSFAYSIWDVCSSLDTIVRTNMQGEHDTRTSLTVKLFDCFVPACGVMCGLFVSVKVRLPLVYLQLG